MQFAAQNPPEFDSSFDLKLEAYVLNGFTPDVIGVLYCDNARSKKFTADLRAMFPKLVYANEHAGFGYVAVKAMAKAWAKAGTTKTEDVFKALEGDIEVVEAPGGDWILRGDQHHAAMPSYLFKVNDDHTLTLITDLGMTEPSFLKEAGVDMRKAAPNRQFLPPDNPAWAKYFKK